MTWYTRIQLRQILDVGESFLVELEREEIIVRDAPPQDAGEYSERMLERARVAANLVNDLEVNLAGVAIIVRMREDMARQRRRIERALAQMSK